MKKFLNSLLVMVGLVFLCTGCGGTMTHYRKVDLVVYSSESQSGRIAPDSSDVYLPSIPSPPSPDTWGDTGVISKKVEYTATVNQNNVTYKSSVTIVRVPDTYIIVDGPLDPRVQSEYVDNTTLRGSSRVGVFPRSSTIVGPGASGVVGRGRLGIVGR